MNGVRSVVSAVAGCNFHFFCGRHRGLPRAIHHGSRAHGTSECQTAEGRAMLSPEEIMAWSLGPALPPQLESPTTAGDDSVDSAAMPDESIVRSTDGDR